ncbi:MAG: zinc ribbon domain-containing protein [Acidobacteriota bacterium]
MFCGACGNKVENPNAVICVSCGSSLMAGGGKIYPSAPPKDPVLMAILSGCCIAGLGQIVIGQVGKGVLIMIGSVILALFTVGLSILITWPLGALDAYIVAKKLAEGRPVGQWEFF